MQETNAVTTASAQIREVLSIPGLPTWVNLTIIVIGLFVATLIVCKIIDLIYFTFGKVKPHKRTIFSLVAVVFKVLVWLICLTIIMTVLDINFGPFLACLGVGGITLGIALKDSITSLMAGVTLIVGEVFLIGDVIEVGGIEGEVEEITIRYTKLLADNHRIYVPNTNIVNSVVTLKKSTRLPKAS